MTQHTLTLNQASKVILVEGSTTFVDVFVTNLQDAFNLSKGWQLTYEQLGEVSFAKVAFHKNLYALDGVFTHILKSASTVLVNEHTNLNGKNAIVRYEHYTFTFTPDVVDAIRQQAEITYLVNCKLAKNLSSKNIARAENLVEYFHDTCCTYYDHKSLTTDRYYFTSLQQPLPIKEIVQLCTGVHFILEQFNQVTELNCTLKATGVTRKL